MSRARPTLHEWLAEAPYGLTLSAGFFGFFAHTGFAMALEDAGLEPERLSGSSAGAMVAGFWASGRRMSELERLFTGVRRGDFWDPSPGLGLLRGALFEALLERELGAANFESCARPLAVSTFDVMRRETNVVTEGPLARAIRASCTFPGLFHPVAIDGRPHIDGGVLDRSGLDGMPHGRRVLYHHLSTRSRVRRHIRRLSLYAARESMLTVVVNDLPRVGPFRLEAGPAAIATARRALEAALSRPIPASGDALIL